MALPPEARFLGQNVASSPLSGGARLRILSRRELRVFQPRVRSEAWTRLALDDG